MKNIFGLILIAGLIFSAQGYANDANPGIAVKNAWVLAMPASQTSTAAFMTIENNSDKDMVLASASTDISNNTEIHEMSQMHGMMHMAMVGDLHIAPHSSLVLKRGGYHMMLINLKKPATKGEKVDIALQFKDGTKVGVYADIRDE